MLNSVSSSTAIASFFQQQQVPPIAAIAAAGSMPPGKTAGPATPNVPSNSSESQIRLSSGLDSTTLSALVQSQQTAVPNAQNPRSAYQQGSFQTDFQNVVGALQSGDVKAAQAAYSVISQLNAGTNGVTFDGIGVPKQYQDTLKQIGASLQSGDLAGAQQALGPLSSYQQGDFQADFQNVAGALQSGDVKAAQAAYSTISQLNAGTNGVTFDRIGVPKQYQDALKQIGDGLQSGNFATAQQALGPLSYQQGSFQTDFQNVASAIQSGDVKAAQAAYSAISELNSGANGVSFDGIGVPKEYQAALKQIGDGLQSGDLAGAQQALVPLQVTPGG